MAVTINNRWTGEVIATVEDTDSVRKAVIRLVRQGVSLADANLTGANLTEANLTEANLTEANLTEANLTGANLTRANLTWANLTEANLTEANLTGANLTRANLTEANLTEANLTPIRDDFYAVLSAAPAEVPALIAALESGRVNGSSYRDDSGCGCLVGTLALARNHDDPTCNSLPGLVADSSRPAERFFLMIRKGDKPETNQAAKIARDWAAEWLGRMREAFVVTT